MGAIELDYLRGSRRATWVRWLLLVTSVAWAADVSWAYARAREQLADSDARLARPARQLPKKHGAAAAGAVTEEDVALARETISRLTVPWNNLLGALETVPRDNVALLAIEPDAAAGTLLLTGEARDYLALLTYVTRLSDEKGLRDVRLARHEARQGDPRKPIAFSVSATWRNTR
jgi:Tfp pilus assembly protein PilN